MKKIYVVLMNTGTIPSKVISLATRCEYSHVAISFSRDCNTMYSFGRRKVNNFINGGFVVTHKNGDFFKKFDKTKCIIYETDVTNNQYKLLKNIIESRKNNPYNYKYDFVGIILRYFKIPITFKNKYVCSYFIADLLEQANIYNFDKKSCFVKPEDFISISCFEKIYQGDYLSYK